MKKSIVIAGAVLLVAVIVAATVPLWMATAGMELPAPGIGAVVIMIIGGFAVGGGLMFLIFLSARRGHDENVHGGAVRDSAPDENSPPSPGSKP